MSIIIFIDDFILFFDRNDDFILAIRLLDVWELPWSL